MLLKILVVASLSSALWAIRLKQRNLFHQEQSVPLLGFLPESWTWWRKAPQTPLVPATWDKATSHCVQCAVEGFSPKATPPCSKMLDDHLIYITDQLKDGETDYTLAGTEYLCCCKAKFTNSRRQIVCDLKPSNSSPPKCSGMVSDTWRWNDARLTSATTWRDLLEVVREFNDQIHPNPYDNNGSEDEGPSAALLPPAKVCAVPITQLHALSFPGYTDETSACTECHDPGFNLQGEPCSVLSYVFEYYDQLVLGDNAQADNLKRLAQDAGVPDKYLDEVWLDATIVRVGKVADHVRREVRKRDEAGCVSCCPLYCSRGSTDMSLTRPDSDADPTIFEQTFLQQDKLNGCKVKTVRFGEGEVDDGGPRIEWLNSVLESVTRPAERTIADRSEGMGSLAHETRFKVPFAYEERKATHENPKFLLEERNDYEIPIWSELGKGLRQEGVLGPAAEARFSFLGRWLVLAHILDPMKQLCPRNLHPYMYDSIAAGRVVEPDMSSQSYYAVEYQIRECEWLANLQGGYADLGPYAPLNPGAQSNIRPLYTADQETWESLYQEFLLDARGRQKRDDEVPYADRVRYTHMVCSRVWRDRFVAPMTAIIKGFDSIIRRDLGELGGKSLTSVPASLTGEQLKLLLEGLPTPLSAERMLEHAEFARWDEWGRMGDRWSGNQIAMFKRAVKRLDRAELKTFLIFITNNGREPLGGFVGGNRLNFNLIRQDKSPEQAAANKCPLFLAHTCYKLLDVPDACMMNPRDEDALNAFVEALKLSIPNRRYAFA